MPVGGRDGKGEKMKKPGIEEAIGLALRVHAGQVDKRGKPYILHVLAVALAFSEAEETLQIVGVLHDAVEDSGLTLEDLAKAGYPEEVIEGVDAVTRRKDESYNAYLDRAASNPMGLKVKIADATHNLRRCRMAASDTTLPAEKREEFGRMAEKYNKAIARVLRRASDVQTGG